MSNKSLNPIVSIIFALQVCSIFAMAEDEGTRDTSLDVQAAPNCSYIGYGSSAGIYKVTGGTDPNSTGKFFDKCEGLRTFPGVSFVVEDGNGNCYQIQNNSTSGNALFVPDIAVSTSASKGQAVNKDFDALKNSDIVKSKTLTVNPVYATGKCHNPCGKLYGQTWTLPQVKNFINNPEYTCKDSTLPLSGSVSYDNEANPRLVKWICPGYPNFYCGASVYPNCSSGTTVNWGTNNACSGPISAAANPPIKDSTGTSSVPAGQQYTGSANFTCSASGSWAFSNGTCDPSPCGPQSVSWTDSSTGVICSGYLSNKINSGDPATQISGVSQSPANYAGTGNISCSLGTISASGSCKPQNICTNGASVSWSATGNTCSGQVSSSANPILAGSSGSASDSTNNGSATCTCSANGTWSCIGSCAGDGQFACCLVTFSNRSRIYIPDIKSSHDKEEPPDFPCSTTSSVFNDSYSLFSGSVKSTQNVAGTPVPNTNPVKYYGKSYCK